MTAAPPGAAADAAGAGDPGAKPLLIGLGNELRGDDAAGLLFARALGERLGDGIDAIEHEGEPVALLDLWEGASCVLVADAVDGYGGAAGTPGAAHRFDAVAGPLPALLGGPSTHALGLAETIELARALGRLPETLVVLAIEGEQFGTGEPPTGAVLEAIEHLAETERWPATA